MFVGCGILIATQLLGTMLLVPFTFLRTTPYFRAGSILAVVLVGLWLIGTTAQSFVLRGAVELRKHGSYSSLRGQVGIYPQVATVRWASGEPLVPADRRVLVLGQSEEALWIYDCLADRTIRVSGSSVDVTQLGLVDKDAEIDPIAAGADTAAQRP
jgi:hypothetical protein